MTEELSQSLMISVIVGAASILLAASITVLIFCNIFLRDYGDKQTQNISSVGSASVSSLAMRDKCSGPEVYRGLMDGIDYVAGVKLYLMDANKNPKKPNLDEIDNLSYSTDGGVCIYSLKPVGSEANSRNSLGKLLSVYTSQYFTVGLKWDGEAYYVVVVEVP